MIKLVKSTLQIFKTLALILLLGCIVAFMTNNRQPLSISFYPLPFTIETKLYLVMLSFFLLGLFLGLIHLWKNWVIAKIIQFKSIRTISKLRKQLDKQDKTEQNNA